MSAKMKNVQARLAKLITKLYERGDLTEDELKEFEMIEIAIDAYVYAKEEI
jgi:polyhydroxyalkanoate synthesis regulator phasin